MKKICLQAGHWNITAGATGAPGEQELNLRILLRLKDILIAKGFQLFLVDANPPDAQINQDFDLFLALHGDADYPGDGGSGFVDIPDPSVDSVNDESQRIAWAIRQEYFKHSGITEVNRSNGNTRFYYMWSRLTAKTPCVLIEMGQVQDPHDKVILADTERVASAIARGICKAFGVVYDQSPVPPVVNWEQKYNDEVKAHTATKREDNDIISSLRDHVNRLTSKIENAKKALV